MKIKELSEEKLKIGSEIFRDIGQVFFASMVIGVLVNTSDLSLAFFGLLFSIISWLLSLVLIK